MLVQLTGQRVTRQEKNGYDKFSQILTIYLAVDFSLQSEEGPGN